jgi:putative membrane protein
MEVPGRGDPRVYLAAERTLLAWLRTGIAVMAFGFVVERFGLFARLLQVPAREALAFRASLWLGVALVGLGVAAAIGGVLQFQRYSRGLAPEEIPVPSGRRLALVLGWALAAIGVLLCASLLSS